ncbi:hypothetical protein Bca52824_049108 [Brassica carinata]|uniref:PIR2-like helical domain-containing protein n=1 Tax=Brassica carinata TaxID=52824 RepID=A0A8X7RI23_BRACI|nr:hypothetical protein Bca52824_049108 [Brassica carinata]
MGCTVRTKHVRPNRKTRSTKPEFDPSSRLLDKTSLPRSIVESSLRHLVDHNHQGLLDSNPGGNFEDNDALGYCTEEQLEDLLLKHLECLYNEAVSKLVSLGHGEDVALRAVLSNGYCYGGMDVSTNIVHNALACLKGGNGEDKDEDGSGAVFADLRQLVEYSLAGMVYLLKQVKPCLSKGDALWCLLVSELHVGKASTIDIPSSGKVDGGSSIVKGVDSTRPGSGEELKTLEREIDCPRRFNLSPAMKSLLRENVAAFAAGYHASMKQKKMQSEASDISLSCADTSEESVGSVMGKFQDLNLDDGADSAPEEKGCCFDRTISSGSGSQKATKGEERMGAEEGDAGCTEEMENDLRKVSGHVDKANMIARRLENENAVIRLRWKLAS